METHYVRANFENGDSLETKINATKEEIEEYYIGKIFNLGAINDDLQKCISIEFLN